MAIGLRALPAGFQPLFFNAARTRPFSPTTAGRPRWVSIPGVAGLRRGSCGACSLIAKTLRKSFKIVANVGSASLRGA
mgnify:CR=1 FL=1